MLLIHDMSSDKFKNLLIKLPDNTKIISKEMKNIHPCIGCFSCWLKTPGKCIINDDYTFIPKYIIDNDVVVIITEIKYGCYSSYIKNVFERSIGVLLPFMRKYNKETHHSIRYKKRIPKLVFIGYGKNLYEDEKKTFIEIVKGNSINYGAGQNYQCHIVENDTEIKTIIESISEGK